MMLMKVKCAGGMNVMWHQRWVQNMSMKVQNESPGHDVIDDAMMMMEWMISEYCQKWCQGSRLEYCGWLSWAVDDVVGSDELAWAVSHPDFCDYSILKLCGLCSLHSQAPLVSRCPLASQCFCSCLNISAHVSTFPLVFRHFCLHLDVFTHVLMFSLTSRCFPLFFSHWGRGPMETSEYIVNTLKTLVQFTQPFTTRYILGTFQMLLCYLSNMCLQNNISNVSRIIPQMFPTCTQKSHGDQIEKI